MQRLEAIAAGWDRSANLNSPRSTATSNTTTTKRGRTVAAITARRRWRGCAMTRSSSAIARKLALDTDLAPRSGQAVIIDESDGERTPLCRRGAWHAAFRPQTAGCDQVAADRRAARMDREEGAHRYLRRRTDTGRLSVQQDWPWSTARITNVERNGHHYVNGRKPAQAEPDAPAAHRSVHAQHGAGGWPSATAASRWRRGLPVSTAGQCRLRRDAGRRGLECEESLVSVDAHWRGERPWT